MSDKDAKDFVDEMAAEPRLDEFFTRNPAKMTDADLDAFIESERRKRAEFIQKEQSK